MTQNINTKGGTFSFYAGVFLISGLVMVLQILQSRIFSVTSWYHLSFLVISMAMFGLTLGALKIYRGNEQAQRRDYNLIARKHTMAFGFFAIIGLLCQLFIPIISGHILYTLVTLPIVAVTTSAAYYHAGVVITTCLTRSPYPIGRVYGIDLLGAGLGCVVALLMMENFDAPSGVLFVAALGFITAILFPVANTSENRIVRLGNTVLDLKKTSLAFIVGASLFGVANIALPSPILFTIWVKDRIVPMSTLAYEDWNSISRITVSNERKDTHPFLWGPSPKTPENHKIDRYMLTIDGDAGTPITKFDGDFSKHNYLEYDVINLAYSLPNIKTAAIVGVGGGRDLLSAKYFGVEDVTALDVNPVQIRLLKDHPEFRDYSNLYKLPGVTILNEEARSWFRQNDKKLDLVQMSLIDTWAATGAGAFALSENGLYTVEAWSIFMNDLSDHGVFTVSRWTSDTLNDGGRTLSVAMAALFKQGIKEAHKHIVIANSEHIATIIISKSPFTSEQLAAINSHADKMDYKIVLAPDRSSPDGMFGELLQAQNIDDLYEIAGRQFFDVSPSTDMRPFFFNQARLSKPFEILGMLLFSGEATHGVAFGQAKATVNLFIIILFSLIMVGFVIINPLLKTVEDKSSTFIKAGTLYFILIGLGFMLIEISLLQALGVFLGHPIYGLSVLLFSLILSAGIGSFMSDVMPLKTLLSQLTWCVCAFVYGIALSIYLNGIFDAYAESDIYTRVLASIAIISPAGILMGFGFPTGLGLTEKFDRRATSWFWGINGAAGVLGSSAAIAFNIALGIDKTLILGSFCYLLLAISFLALNSCTVKKS